MAPWYLHRVPSMKANDPSQLEMGAQQRQRDAVLRRFGNVIQLRDPWAVYGQDDNMLFRIPMSLRQFPPPRMPEFVGYLVDALMLLGREAPHVFNATLASGLTTGWAAPAGPGYRIGVPYPRPLVVESCVVMEIRSMLATVSETDMMETFQIVGGVRRLVDWAKDNPIEFANLCGAVFLPLK